MSSHIAATDSSAITLPFPPIPTTHSLPETAISTQPSSVSPALQTIAPGSHFEAATHPSQTATTCTSLSILQSDADQCTTGYSGTDEDKETAPDSSLNPHASKQDAEATRNGQDDTAPSSANTAKWKAVKGEGGELLRCMLLGIPAAVAGITSSGIA